MRFRIGALIGSIAIVVIAGLAVTRCGDGGGDDPPNGATPSVTSPDQNRAATSTTSDGTPLPFESQRDELADRLDAIGANVGAVPADIRQELLIMCGNLAGLADRETVQQLCNGMNQAFINDDPDLMDLVVRELRNLEAS